MNTKEYILQYNFNNDFNNMSDSSTRNKKSSEIGINETHYTSPISEQYIFSITSDNDPCFFLPITDDFFYYIFSHFTMTYL